MKLAYIVAAFVGLISVDAIKLNLKQQMRLKAMTRSKVSLKVSLGDPSPDDFRDLESRLLDAADKDPGVDFNTFLSIVH
jgi:hypothetical protein